MTQQLNYLTRLLGFQGVYVSGIEIREEGDIGIVLVDLKRQEDGYICSGCGRKVFSKHSSWVQEVRHLYLQQLVAQVTDQGSFLYTGSQILSIKNLKE